MSMSRKDFVGIADTLGLHIRNADDDHDKAVIRSVALALTIDLKIANPNFDRDRFLDHVADVADGTRGITS